MSVFIGIEGVGMRQSVAIASDEEGNILSATRIPYGVSMHSTLKSEVLSRLQCLLSSLVENSNLKSKDLKDSTVCVGITGVTFPFDAHNLGDQFAKLGIETKKLICTGDVEIIFASHALTDTGSAVLCHMGSTAYVALPEKNIRFGGWGPAIGDEGSGYWMGRSALRAIGEEHDHNPHGSGSVLWEQIRRWLEHPETSVPELKEATLMWERTASNFKHGQFDLRTAIFSYAHEVSVQNRWLWRVIASSLTIPLMKAWEEGDSAAQDIVMCAADHLCDQLAEACSVADVHLDHGPLVMYGGVFTYHSNFRNLVYQKIVALKDGDPDLVTPETRGTTRPAVGALLFALGDSETGRFQLPNPQLIDHLIHETNESSYSELLRND